MKVAFIFEDNEKSRLGHILSSVSYNRENIYFAKSNTRVAKKVKQIYDSYDCIVVFFDLVPNNKELYSVIKRTINYLSTKNMLDKLFIIPIICSEYIYFTTISENFGISLPNFSLINTVNYSKSCEKYYKRFLDNDEFGIKEGSYSKYEGDYFCTGYPLFDVVIYSALSLFVATRVCDFFLSYGNAAKAVQIVSKKTEELSKKILADIKRGVTGIYCKGMYSKEGKLMLLCIVSPRQLPKLIGFVKEIDSKAFVSISDVREVLGEGFK